MSHLERARAYLRDLKEEEGGNVLYDLWIKYIHEEMVAGALTLSDIGTSEGEVEELRIKGCAAIARGRLDCLRRYPDDGEWWKCAYDALQDQLKKGGLTPEAIGSNDQELAQIYARGHKATAIMCLKMLRKIRHPTLLSYLKDSLSKAKLNFADIGTGDEEINRLIPPSKWN